jgi:hypothetical protein
VRSPVFPICPPSPLAPHLRAVVEWALSQHGHGALTTELDEDPRGPKSSGKGSLFATATAVGGRGGRRRGYGSDSDDDEDDDR